MRTKVDSPGAQLQVPLWIRALGRPLGLRPVLLTPTKIVEAQRLLYRVYHDEQGWHPEPGNLSGLRTELTDGPRFVDDFDESAVWIGVLRQQRVVATTRVLVDSPGRPLEVARYCKIPAALTTGAVEANRLAIEHGFRGGGAMALIALLLAWVAHLHDAERDLIAVQEPIAKRVFRPLGWTDTGLRFRYHDDDRHPCELMSLETGTLQLFTALGKTVGKRSLAGGLKLAQGAGWMVRGRETKSHAR